MSLLCKAEERCSGRSGTNKDSHLIKDAQTFASFNICMLLFNKSLPKAVLVKGIFNNGDNDKCTLIYVPLRLS